MFLLAGIVLGWAFARRQSRIAEPMLDLSLFRVPAFSAALAVNVLSIFIAFGYFLFIAQYFQLVLGMTPLQAGLWTAPTGLVFVAGAMLAPKLARRWSLPAVLAGGLALSAVGFLVLGRIGDLSFAGLMAGYLLFCAGLGPLGALGIAVLGSLVMALYRHSFAAAAPDGLPADAIAAASATLGAAVDVAAGLGAAGDALRHAARGAYVETMATAAWLCAALSFAASAAIILSRRWFAVRRPG